MVMLYAFSNANQALMWTEKARWFKCQVLKIIFEMEVILEIT